MIDKIKHKCYYASKLNKKQIATKGILTMSNPNQLPTPSEQIQDLVDVNRIDQPIRPDGSVMSRNEIDQITAHQDQIREGLGGHDNVFDKNIADSLDNYNKNREAEAKQAAAEEAAAAKAQAREDALTTLNKLIRTKKPLDGPTLSKAGIGFMSQQELGFASFDDMKQAAAEQRATQARERREAKKAEEAAAQVAAEEAAAKAAQEAKEQQAAANRAAGKAQAEAWKTETAAWRENRATADDRISKLQDGSAAVEGLSYKERLERGGELGIKFQQEHSNLTAEDAIAQAAAEGYDVRHTAPRHYEVTRNEAAEAQAAQTAAALKDFHRQIFGANVREAAPAEPAVDNEPAVEPIVSVAVPEVVANEQAEGQGVVIEDGAAARSEESLVTGASRAKAMLGRMKDKLMTKGVQLTNAINQKLSGKYETGTLDEVTYRRRQRMITGVIMGGAAMYLTTKFAGAELPFFGGGGVAQAATEHGSGNGGHGALSVLGERQGNGGGHDPLSVLSERGNGGGNNAHETVTLKPGETVWSEAADALPKGASTAQIDELKDAILQKNGKTEAQAMHLPVGVELQMPMDEIAHIEEEIKKAKAA
jgi:hypothetical protein